MRGLQFSLASLLWSMAAIGAAAYTWRIAGRFPYWAVLPTACLLGACWAAPQRRDADLAWGLIALGWQLALLDLAWTGARVLFVTTHPTAEVLRWGMGMVFASGIPLPLALTFPAVRLAARASRKRLASGVRWILLGAALSIADVLLLFGGLYVLVPVLCGR